MQHYAEKDRELANRLSLNMIESQYEDVFQQPAPSLAGQEEEQIEQVRRLARRSIASNFSINGFERNLLFLNKEGKAFKEVSAFSNLDSIADARSFALLDIDLDGRQDVVIKNFRKQLLEAYQNVYPSENHRVVFRLTGGGGGGGGGGDSNRDAIGARIHLKTPDGRTQMKQVRSAFGFLSQNTPDVFFGLAQEKQIAEVEIFWPSGQKQIFQDLPVDGFIAISEGNPQPAFSPFRQTISLAEDPLVLKRPVSKILRDAPPFSTSTLSGQKIDSASFFAQKPTVVFFMTPWCTSCKKDIKIFHQLPEPTPYQILIVNVRSPNEPYIPLPELPSNIPLISDDTSLFLKYFLNVNIGFPTRYWVTTDGKIVQQIQGGLEEKSLSEEYELYFHSKD